MEDIRRQDQKLFFQELKRPIRLVSIAAAIWFAAAQLPQMPLLVWLVSPGLLLAAVTAISVVTAYRAAISKRFHNKRFEALWNGCRDRFERFEQVLRSMRNDQIADLKEMNRTIKRVAESLYVALRRADSIANEIQKTEQGIYSQPPVWQSPSDDAQAKELYRLADKNIAEYRQQFAGVMAGVQRTEAQTAVFMTTLDTLRMKMIGHRLVGRAPEMSSHDFLEALAEARVQLTAIDTALEELDFSQFPQTISVIPPPPPTEAFDQQRSAQGP
jgi:membrane glycosyltransferase